MPRLLFTLFRVNDTSGSIHANAPEGPTGGNVERLQIGLAEAAVRHLVRRNRDKVLQLPFLTEDVDAALILVCGLVRRMRFVQTRSDIERTFRVHLEAVGP